MRGSAALDDALGLGEEGGSALEFLKAAPGVRGVLGHVVGADAIVAKRGFEAFDLVEVELQAGGDDQVVVRESAAVSGVELVCVGGEGGDGVLDPGDAWGHAVGLVAPGGFERVDTAADEGPEGLVVVV